MSNAVYFTDIELECVYSCVKDYYDYLSGEFVYDDEDADLKNINLHFVSGILDKLSEGNSYRELNPD